MIESEIFSREDSSPHWFLKEIRWVCLAAWVLFLLLIFVSYTPHDPAWSHSETHVATSNFGGAVGAWVADFLLYFFGFSAYIFPLSAAFFLVPVRIKRGVFSLHPALRVIGFVVLLISLSTLENIIFFAHHLLLPDQPGGVLGVVVATVMQHALGHTGSVLLLLVGFMAGVSLLTGLSWLFVCEVLGHWVEYVGYLLGMVIKWLVHHSLFIQANTVTEKRPPASTHAVLAYQDMGDQQHSTDCLLEEGNEIFFSAPDSKPGDPESTDHAVPSPFVVEPAQQNHAEPSHCLGVLNFLHKTVSRTVDFSIHRRKASKKNYQLPSVQLLSSGNNEGHELVSGHVLEATSRLIEAKLKEFGVCVRVISAFPGPVVTRYDIEPDIGVKGAQVTNLVKDLARSLSVLSIRVVETIPGTSCMGLEIPNQNRQLVYLADILNTTEYKNAPSILTLALGHSISGQSIVADLCKMPHLLVAGTTGSGKSVAINVMILSLLYRAKPSQLRLLLIDPKILELSVYEGIGHLLAPVVTDMKKAAQALAWCVMEMERRYCLMSAIGVRHLASFNQKIQQAHERGETIGNPSAPPAQQAALEELPFIVIVIDELADLIMVIGKKIEELIARLAQKARAAGIHLILATQRPSVDVITGLIKANIPTRIAFQVSSKIDSRTILDQSGAESLLGQGDMLYLPPGLGYPVRVHGAYIVDDDVHAVAQYLRNQCGTPDYVVGIFEESNDPVVQDEDKNREKSKEEDDLYDEAVKIVFQSKRPSISLVQRHLRIGYNRAARIIERMEKEGFVSAMQSNGNRDFLPGREKEDLF